jgi:hypothetical protein
MRKTPTRRPFVSRLGTDPEKSTVIREDVCYLHHKIDTERDLVDCTQRAVARGRRSVVDAKCRVLLFRQRAPERSPDAGGNVTEAPGRLAELTVNVDEIHERLLLLSGRVELEIDGLDIIRAEIDRLTPAGGHW